MAHLLRPFRQVIPVKVASRVAGYLLTAAVTAVAIVVLAQFDLSSAVLGTGHLHHRSNPKDAPSEPAAVNKRAVENTVPAQPAAAAPAPSGNVQMKKDAPAPSAQGVPSLLSAVKVTEPVVETISTTGAAAAPAAAQSVATTAVAGYRSRFIPPAGGCKEMKKMIILHWDPHWEWHRHPNGLKEFMDCEKSASNRCMTWYSTSDRSYASKADIIVAHDWSGYPALPERAFPSQLFMYMTMESPYSGYSAQHLQHMFNLAYKYHLSSHVRAAYIPIGTKSFTEIHGAPHFTFKEKIDAVSSLVSNCGGFVPRLDFMRDLNQHVPVHSFGRCFHNHELTSYHDISLLEKYKVAMVFENSLCYDYVTEKWWRALTQGTIPLVTSNNRIPDYRKYSPTLHCYLDYGQFKDMPALVAELKKLFTDEAVFNHYMDYRTLPEDKFNPLFRDQFSSSSCDDFCKLGLKINDPEELAKLVKGHNQKDDSCRPHGVLK